MCLRKAAWVPHIHLALLVTLVLLWGGGCCLIPPIGTQDGQQEQSASDDSGQGSPDAPGDATGDSEGDDQSGGSGEDSQDNSDDGFVGPPPPDGDQDDDAGDDDDGDDDGSGDGGDDGNGDDDDGDDGDDGENAEFIELISVGLDGQPANNESQSGSASSDGHFVVFSSPASNLVADDNNLQRDIFLRDRVGLTTQRINLGSAGSESDGPSLAPRITPDGTLVVFSSWATNLVPADGNDTSDVFVWDRVANVLERVSVSSDGTEADGPSQSPTISADGRYVAFESQAENLAGGSAADLWDVFVHDRQTGLTRCLSTGVGGAPANGDSRHASISADGSLVAFDSAASNLVADDNNDAIDVFVHDRVALSPKLISRDASDLPANGDSLNPHMGSAEGQFIAFESDATNLVAVDANDARDVFVYYQTSGAIVAVSKNTADETGNGASGAPTISDDGLLVAFESLATDLVVGDTNHASDVFVRDMLNSTTVMQSVNQDGAQGNAGSIQARLTPDGAFVAFESKATNLTDQLDIALHSDIFLRTRAE